MEQWGGGNVEPWRPPPHLRAFALLQPGVLSLQVFASSLLVRQGSLTQPPAQVYLPHGICLEALTGPCSFTFVFCLFCSSLWNVIGFQWTKHWMKSGTNQTTHSHVMPSDTVCDLVPYSQGWGLGCCFCSGVWLAQCQGNTESWSCHWTLQTAMQALNELEFSGSRVQCGEFRRTRRGTDRNSTLFLLG